ncbi:unnamed protein product [Gongylonema pulchrum]|uniref:Ribosomal protein S18 n=1 Tax=Gongylonema pulchrum TaxID=637853 RepID=A0A183D0Z3_9BILA|nr:unnamed protein product [Gongylonema pulchrum]
MRDDGTVLPRALTGLCKKQQSRIERCVMQSFYIYTHVCVYLYMKAVKGKRNKKKLEIYAKKKKEKTIKEYLILRAPSVYSF